MPQFIDSHCHLDRIDLSSFDHSFDALIKTTQKANIKHMLCVGIALSTWQRMADLVAPYTNISLSVGVHPSDVENGAEYTYEHFAPMLKDSRVIAIGETGLDYHYHLERKSVQQAAFIQQIEIAKTAKKPLIIHTREAKQDTINILKAEGAREVGAVMHCFTEDWEMAKKTLDLGFYLSFSGIITFNSAQSLREIVKKVPLDRLLIETDSPYLAPMPFRGKLNHPGLIPHIAQKVAELKEVPIETIAKITNHNFSTLFNVLL